VANLCIGLSVAIGVQNTGNPSDARTDASFAVSLFPVADGELFVQQKSGLRFRTSSLGLIGYS